MCNNTLLARARGCFACVPHFWSEIISCCPFPPLEMESKHFTTIISNATATDPIHLSRKRVFTFARGEGTTAPRKIFNLYYTVRERVYISILDCAAANRMERMRAFVCVVLSSQARTHTTVCGWNTRNTLYVYSETSSIIMYTMWGHTACVCVRVSLRKCMRVSAMCRWERM